MNSDLELEAGQRPGQLRRGQFIAGLGEFEEKGFAFAVAFFDEVEGFLSGQGRLFCCQQRFFTGEHALPCFDDLEAAAGIGADVAFCLVGGRARVSGIGEVVESLPFEARRYTLLLPPFGCSTPAVYAKWDELGGPEGESGNDLEAAALAVEPGLAEYRDRLGDATGETPRLAGSGSTWFVDGAHPGGGRVVVSTIPAT